jgi:hypothetical protein
VMTWRARRRRRSSYGRASSCARAAPSLVNARGYPRRVSPAARCQPPAQRFGRAPRALSRSRAAPSARHGVLAAARRLGRCFHAVSGGAGRFRCCAGQPAQCRRGRCHCRGFARQPAPVGRPLSALQRGATPVPTRRPPCHVRCRANGRAMWRR